MTIELLTPYTKIPEKLADKINQEMLQFLHTNLEISKAEVLLRKYSSILKGGNKVCEITLSVLGHNLFVHTRTKSFKQSAKEAISELKAMVKLQEKDRKKLQTGIQMF